MGIEDPNSNAINAPGDDGGLDLTAAGDVISADLFGSSVGDGNGGGTDDVVLGDGADTDSSDGTNDPTASRPPAEKTGKQPATQTAGTLQAPKTWRPEAAAKFASLPPEVQQEILWLCEAAHVPVIWATQVLESYLRTGLPSRGEMTDAAMAAQLACGPPCGTSAWWSSLPPSRPQTRSAWRARSPPTDVSRPIPSRRSAAWPAAPRPAR